jgi:hypothetical protein
MYRPFASAAASSSAFLDVESTIRGLTQDLCLAFNTGNYDQWAACFASDGQMMAPNREPAHRRFAWTPLAIWRLRPAATPLPSGRKTEPQSLSAENLCTLGGGWEPG